MNPSNTSKEMPFVSVVVSNRNSGKFLLGCVASILSSNYKNLEVIIVDNASTDESADLVRNSFSNDPRVNIIQNAKDLGPTGGRNIGIRRARGEYVAFLDSDTKVESSWLTEFVKVLKANPAIGACQSKLLLMNDPKKFDYAGDYLSPYGILVQRVRHGEEDKGQFEIVEEIFSAKSASLIIRRDVLREIGLFDEDFYMFVEETDLCWRVWLSGYSVVFVPKSLVYHAFGTYMSAVSRADSKRPNFLMTYYGTRNYLMMCVKNLDTRNMLLIVPLHISIWIAISVWYIIRGDLTDAFWVLKGILWNFRNISLVWRKRETVQNLIRRVPDSSIMPRIMRNESILYFLGKLHVWKRYTRANIT